MLPSNHKIQSTCSILSCAAHAQKSVSLYLTSFPFRLFMLIPAYLFQKDERGLPGNLQSSKRCWPPSPLLTSPPLPFTVFSLRPLRQSSNWLAAPLLVFPLALSRPSHRRASSLPSGPSPFAPAQRCLYPLSHSWERFHWSILKSWGSTPRQTQPSVQPTHCVMLPVAAIVFTHNIRRLFFLIEGQCVVSAVRTECNAV